MKTETNEEKRVIYYATNDSPTISSRVNPDTPLSELNLNWREKELPERERTKHVHRLHPYLGKFIPQLVEIFLRKYFRPGQTVLDPFAGSGTTLVQANELGVNSIGYDISAFNVLLVKAKTQSYDIILLKKEILDIIERVQEISQSSIFQPSLWSNTDRISSNHELNGTDYLRKWFAPQALSELLLFRDLINDYHYQDILKVILSRSARSARLTTHFDLDFPKTPQIEPYWCYKHSRTCQPTTTAYQFLKRYSLDTIKRVEDYSTKRTNAPIDIYNEDSTIADFPYIDGVITSPPYVGLIDYHEQHRYAYELLGLKDQSPAEIGPAKNGSSKRAQQDYKELIAQVLRRARNSMPSGGRLIVVAGDRHNLYDDIAKLCEVEVEAIINRHVNRRTGRRSSDFFESVFIWRKP
jgi:DNA modification methylase